MTTATRQALKRPAGTVMSSRGPTVCRRVARSGVRANVGPSVSSSSAERRNAAVPFTVAPAESSAGQRHRPEPRMNDRPEAWSTTPNQGSSASVLEQRVTSVAVRGSLRAPALIRTRHVISYLEDFLFEPVRARTPIKALSGGERNRLLLARLITKPANVLVLDEPTNDLDAETLELLEDLLVEFGGTVLLVYHHRAFLNEVSTSLLVFEGEGQISEYVGGYDDWQKARGKRVEGQGRGGVASGSGERRLAGKGGDLRAGEAKKPPCR